MNHHRITVPSHSSWFESYEQMIQKWSGHTRARSVLICPDSYSDSSMSITQISKHIFQSVTDPQNPQPGGCCPDIKTMEQFLIDLPTPPLPHIETTPCVRHGGGVTHVTKVASSQLTKLFMRKAIQCANSSTLSLADLPMLMKLIRYIAHSQPFFEDHFYAPTTQTISPHPLATYAQTFHRFQADSSVSIHAPLVREIAEVIATCEADLHANGYVLSERLLSEKLMLLGGHIRDQPSFIHDCLDHYQFICVAGFLTTSYLEERLLNQILVPHPHSKTSLISFIQQVHRKPDTFQHSPLNPFKAFHLIPQRSSLCVDDDGRRDHKNENKRSKRVSVGFKNRWDEVGFFLRLATQFCGLGIAPHKMAILVPDPSLYEHVFTAVCHRSSCQNTLHLEWTQNIAQTQPGGTVASLWGYLKSSRSAWDFYHLITSQSLWPIIIHQYLLRYSQFKNLTHHTWISHATVDLSPVKEYVSAFISKKPLYQSTSQIIHEQRRRYGHIQHQGALSCEKYLARQELSYLDISRIGEDVFMHSTQYLRRFFQCERSWNQANPDTIKDQMDMLIRMLKDNFQHARAARSFNSYDIRIQESLNRCFAEITLYIDLLDPASQLKWFGSLEKMCEFILMEFEHRYVAPDHLGGLSVKPVCEGLAEPLDVVMVCGMNQRFFNSKHDRPNQWMTRLCASHHPHHHQELLPSLGLGHLWRRIPYQIYGHQLSDNTDQSVSITLAEFESSEPQDSLFKLNNDSMCGSTLEESYQQTCDILFDTTQSHPPHILPPPKDLTKTHRPVDDSLFSTQSPSSWNRLLQCPFRFYLAKKQIKTLSRPETHSQMEKGSWLHQLMECFLTGYEPSFLSSPSPDSHSDRSWPYYRDDNRVMQFDPLSPDDSLTPGALRGRLETIGDALLTPISFLKADHWHQLKSECLPYIAHLFADLFAHFDWPTSIHTEYDLNHSTDDTTLFKDTPYTTVLTGRVDMLMTFKNGLSLVVDYKTKTIPSATDIKHQRDSQLILYAHALQDKHPALAYWALEKNIFQWVYVPEGFDWRVPHDLPGSPHDQTQNPYFVDREALDQTTSAYFTNYQQVRDEISSSKRFEIKPDVKTCQHCDYSQICRKDDPKKESLGELQD